MAVIEVSQITGDAWRTLGPDRASGTAANDRNGPARLKGIGRTKPAALEDRMAQVPHICMFSVSNPPPTRAMTSSNPNY